MSTGWSRRSSPRISLSGWTTSGARPDSARLISLLELAAERGLLDLLFPNVTTRERSPHSNIT